MRVRTGQQFDGIAGDGGDKLGTGGSTGPAPLHAWSDDGYQLRVSGGCVDAVQVAGGSRFWAAALGYVVENQSSLINHLLAANQISQDAVAEHRGRQIFRGYAAIRHPEDQFDEASGIGRGGRMLFQDVPEGKTVKNRLHIDVHSEPGELDKPLARLETLGATRLREVNKGPAGHWWVVQDPEGNEFCVA